MKIGSHKDLSTITRSLLVRATGLCQTIFKTACLLRSFRRTPMNLSPLHWVSFFRSQFFDACREWTYITACCVLGCKEADQSDYPCWYLSTREHPWWWMWWILFALTMWNGRVHMCHLPREEKVAGWVYEEDELLVTLWYLVHYSSLKPILSLICIIRWTAAPT